MEDFVSVTPVVNNYDAQVEAFLDDDRGVWEFAEVSKKMHERQAAEGRLYRNPPDKNILTLALEKRNYTLVEYIVKNDKEGAVVSAALGNAKEASTALNMLIDGFGGLAERVKECVLSLITRCIRAGGQAHGKINDSNKDRSDSDVFLQAQKKSSKKIGKKQDSCI